MVAYQQTFQQLVIPLSIIGGSLLLYFGISYYFKNRISNTADLYVADRSIGAAVNGAAMGASWESLATFMGVVALIVGLQLPFLATWANFMLSIPLVVLLYGQTLRRLGVYTPAKFCQQRFGQTMGMVMALLLVLVMLMYALGQFIGLAQIAEILFGWPFELSLIVIATVVVAYVILGGMYGVSYNAALQFTIMFTAAFVPMMFVLRDLGATGWWFPPLGYTNLTGAMTEALPGFFDLGFGLKWYVAMFLAMALGPIGMPHLAQRVFTSKSVSSGRRSVLWFIALNGLLFATIYSVAFAGVFWTSQQGITVPEADLDKMIYYVNFAFNNDAVTGYVVAGALAGALSTVGAHMMTISATVANDLLDIFDIDIPETQRTRLGYAVIVGAGLIIALVGLNPPAFLVVSILWAFSLAAAAITPIVVLGVWSCRVNSYGVVPASIIGALIVIVFSPHLLPGITFGAEGITAALGMDAAFVAVPTSIIVLVVGSLLAEQVVDVDREKNQRLLNEIHGYPDDGVARFDSAWPLILLVIICIPILWWGLLPWP
jgi:Na+(H+)/acetate symporter ActP